MTFVIIQARYFIAAPAQKIYYVEEYQAD